jgi:hypothetical protein
MLLGEIVAELHCIETGPFAARFADATGRGAQCGAVAAEIEGGDGELLEGGFALVGGGSKEDDVAGRT